MSNEVATATMPTIIVVDETKVSFDDLKREAVVSLEHSITEWNRAQRENDLKALKEADENCVKYRNDYNEAARTEFFAKHCAAESPLVSILGQLEYTGKSWTDKKSKDSGLITRAETDTINRVNLSAFEKYARENAKVTTGKETNWLYYIEKFNQLLVFYGAARIGDNPKKYSDSYAIRQIAKEIEMGATPTSATQILKQLQTVVSAMIGDEYKATSHDAAWVMLAFARPDRKSLHLKASSPKVMNELIAETCHRIITNGEYKVTFRKAK